MGFEFGVLGGSYKWGYKSLIWVIGIVTLLISLLITTQPPSIGVGARELYSLAVGS